MTSNAPGGRLFWGAAGAGWLLIGIGIWGVLKDARQTKPLHLAAWILGSAAAHDFLLAPAAFLVALLVTRAVPARVRPHVQAGLAVSAMVSLAAIPFVGSFGRDPHNPSLLPGNYAAGLAVVLGAVWAAVGLAAARRLRRARRYARR